MVQIKIVDHPPQRKGQPSHAMCCPTRQEKKNIPALSIIRVYRRQRIGGSRFYQCLRLAALDPFQFVNLTSTSIASDQPLRRELCGGNAFAPLETGFWRAAVSDYPI
jgi:hypothetical protein